jgi:hypothetical protein
MWARRPASLRGGPGSILGHMGFVVDKYEYFGFPCQFSFHQLLHTHITSVAGTIGQIAADVPSGLGLTPPQGSEKKKLCGGEGERIKSAKDSVQCKVWHQ